MSAVSGPSFHTAHTAQLGKPNTWAQRGALSTSAIHFGQQLPPISAKKALWSLTKYPFNGKNAQMARSIMVDYADRMADLAVFLPGGFLLFYPILGLTKLFQRTLKPRWDKQLKENGIEPPTEKIKSIKAHWEGKSWKPTEEKGPIQQQFEAFTIEVQDLIKRVFQHEPEASDIRRAAELYQPQAANLEKKGLQNWGYNFLGTAFYSDAYYDGTKIGKVINFLKTQTKTRNPAMTAANRIFKNRLLRILTGPMRLIGLAVQAVMATHFRVSGKMACELAKAVRKTL